jgi:hypothetical protein
MTGRIIRSSSRAGVKERSKSNTKMSVFIQMNESEFVMTYWWTDLADTPTVFVFTEKFSGTATYTHLLLWVMVKELANEWLQLAVGD